MKRSWWALLAGLAAVGGAAIAWLRLSATRFDGDSLEVLTKEELYERARKADVSGRSEMSKDELVDALRSRS